MIGAIIGWLAFTGLAAFLVAAICYEVQKAQEKGRS